MKKHFQQTDFWCDFKADHGWKKITLDDINILVRTFKKGPVSISFAYVPMAPDFVENQDEAEYLKITAQTADKAKNLLPGNTLCIRFDSPLNLHTPQARDEYLERFKKLALSSGVKIKKSSVDIQPPDSTFLDLTKTEDELLVGMKNKWRYNVRYASKHGVEVRSVTAASPDFEKDLNSFYELYRTTASRDGIGIHPLSYYRDLLERGSESEKKDGEEKTKITLYIASHEGEDLAAIITLFNSEEAVYLYGCSGNNKRNLMPAYLVQWTAIRDARAFGSKVYDFYGMPPTDDENHPMHGLYLFKTGFGGERIHRPGSFDIPLKKSYSLYVAAEKFRAFWHKKVMKKIRGR